VMGKNCCNL